MAEHRRVGIWSVVAPVALVGLVVLSVLLVRGALVERPAAPDPPPATTASASVPDASVPATYVVRKGDTISDIAERYGLSSDWILTLNPQVDPVGLPVGTRLNLREPAAP